MHVCPHCSVCSLPESKCIHAHVGAATTGPHPGNARFDPSAQHCSLQCHCPALPACTHSLDSFCPGCDTVVMTVTTSATHTRTHTQHEWSPEHDRHSCVHPMHVRSVCKHASAKLYGAAEGDVCTDIAPATRHNCGLHLAALAWLHPDARLVRSNAGCRGACRQCTRKQANLQSTFRLVELGVQHAQAAVSVCS